MHKIITVAGNKFGNLFSLTTFGESHGLAIGGIIDGCPAGVKIDQKIIQQDLDRRKPGQSKIVSQRKENDIVDIFSGIFEGKSTGTPIGFIIKNKDQKTKDYSSNKNLVRPSHADYTYHQKYGIRDYRGGGRSSARETAMRVAAGGIAKKYLNEQLGVNIYRKVSQLGPIVAESFQQSEIEKNAFFFPDPEKIPALEAYIKALLKAGDSVGAKVRVVAENVPVGLGEPVFDRLDADIAHALMSINAVKGVEIGAGFSAVDQRGSEHRDEMSPGGFLSTNAGGILGGISTGQPITVSYTHLTLPTNREV